MKESNSQAALILSAIILVFLTSCNNNEIKRLKNENDSLKLELDSFKRVEKAKKDFMGMYVNTKGGWYNSIEIKGESSCVIVDGFLGFPFATGYERDGNILRVRTDKSDLMFTIKDSEILIGEGFAEGIYKKKK